MPKHHHHHRTITRTTVLALGMIPLLCSADPIDSTTDPALLTEINKQQTALDTAKERLKNATANLKAQDDEIVSLTTKIANLKAKVSERMNQPATSASVGTDGHTSTTQTTDPEHPLEPRTKTEIPLNFISEVTPYVVVIEGDQGTGTGFLCTTEGQTWVYTAAHVLSGNNRITVRDSQGHKYQKFEFIECAEDVDLVRLKPQQQDLDGLELTTQTEAPGLDEIIVAVGNSLGAGSLSAEGGRVTGIEDEVWEVDAEIIPGNSGGPVICLKNKKVTGIVTHLVINRPRGANSVTREPEVKRFAARLDKPRKWRRMDINRFVKEWKYIDGMKRDSAVAWAAGYLMYVRSGGRNTKGDLVKRAESIIRSESDHINVKRMDTWFKDFSRVNRMNRSELIDKGNEIVSQIYQDIRLNGSEPKAQDFSWFHRQEYENQIDWRTRLTSVTDD